jgi:hypothetical protein
MACGLCSTLHNSVCQQRLPAEGLMSPAACGPAAARTGTQSAAMARPAAPAAWAGLVTLTAAVTVTVTVAPAAGPQCAARPGAPAGTGFKCQLCYGSLCAARLSAEPGPPGLRRPWPPAAACRKEDRPPGPTLPGLMPVCSSRAPVGNLYVINSFQVWARRGGINFQVALVGPRRFPLGAGLHPRLRFFLLVQL